MRGEVERPEVGDEDPGLGVGDGFLKVLHEPVALPQPGKKAFKYPFSRRDFEAKGTTGLSYMW